MKHNQINIEANQITFQGFTVNQYGEVETPETAYLELLNDCYESVSICGMEYLAGETLKSVDSIAFRVGHSDWNTELQSQFEDELYNLIDDIKESYESVFECDTEQNSDNAWNYFECNLADSFAYSDIQLIETLNKNLEFCELPEDITFKTFKDKALDLILDSPEYYCNAKFTNSHWASKDCILGLPIGELEYQDYTEHNLSEFPEWLIDKINRQSDFTINASSGLVYFNVLGIELIIKDFDQLFNDVIESINEDKQDNQGE